MTVASSKQSGKTAAIEGLKPLATVIDEAYRSGAISHGTALIALTAVSKAHKEVEKKENGRGRVHNHGPRPKSTFDQRGRRRY